jgi:hypothetical protein
MVQAMSLFNQLLQHFPALEFAALVKKHKAERAAKGFSCRTQLVAMLFCLGLDQLRNDCQYIRQLTSGKNQLQDVENGLAGEEARFALRPFRLGQVACVRLR